MSRKAPRTKILISGTFSPTDAEIAELTSLGFDVVRMPDETSDLPEEFADASILICNSFLRHHAHTSLAQLRFVQLTSSGVDGIPVDELTDRGIEIQTAGDVYAIPIAEWVVAQVLSHYKQLPRFWRMQQMREWRKSRDLRELTGRRAAIIGTGPIGQEVAKRLRAFDVDVTGLSRTTTEKPAFDDIRPYSAIDDLIHALDLLVLAAPATPLTHHLLDASRLSRLSNGCFLVNVARGALIDEDALARTLANGSIDGAALDVFAEEPLDEDSRLWSLPNVYISPHNSFVSDRIRRRLGARIMDNLRALARAE